MDHCPRNMNLSRRNVFFLAKWHFLTIRSLFCRRDVFLDGELKRSCFFGDVTCGNDGSVKKWRVLILVPLFLLWSNKILVWKNRGRKSLTELKEERNWIKFFGFDQQNSSETIECIIRFRSNLNQFYFKPNFLTLRRPLRKKLRMRWFFDVSKVKESSFLKSDITDPPSDFWCASFDKYRFKPFQISFFSGVYIKIMFWVR